MFTKSLKQLLHFIAMVVFTTVLVCTLAVLLASRSHMAPSGRVIRVRDDVPLFPGEWYQSVQQAINAAGDNPANPDTIEFYGVHEGDNTFSENLIITKTVNLVAVDDPGIPGAERIIISGNGYGRVLTIDGSKTTINTTMIISGLTFEQGDASFDDSAGDEHGASLKGCGGGVLIVSASPTLTNNTIRNNLATSEDIFNGEGQGGGLCLINSSALIISNTITANFADKDQFAASLNGRTGKGGGVYVRGGAPLLRNNLIQFNHATEDAEFGRGGGAYLDTTAAILDGNTIVGNIATVEGLGTGYGGGVYIVDTANNSATPTLINNQIQQNAGGWQFVPGRGGGAYLQESAATLTNNAVTDNTASLGQPGDGGGFYIDGGSPTLEWNLINRNTPTKVALTMFGTPGREVRAAGGAIWMAESAAHITGNTIVDNYECGWLDGLRSSGIWITGSGSNPWYLENNLIARNVPPSDCNFKSDPDALYAGAAVVVENSAGAIVNTTIADHQVRARDIVQSGLLILGSSNVIITNAIIAGSAAGVRIEGTAAVTNLSHTLFFNNEADFDPVGGATYTSVDEVAGNPRFANPAATSLPNYHILSDSAARDRGLATTTPFDIDRQPRVVGAPDIGADEFVASEIRLPYLIR